MLKEHSGGLLLDVYECKRLFGNKTMSICDGAKWHLCLQTRKCHST